MSLKSPSQQPDSKDQRWKQTKSWYGGSSRTGSVHFTTASRAQSSSSRSSTMTSRRACSFRTRTISEDQSHTPTLPLAHMTLRIDKHVQSKQTANWQNCMIAWEPCTGITLQRSHWISFVFESLYNMLCVMLVFYPVRLHVRIRTRLEFRLSTGQITDLRKLLQTPTFAVLLSR